MRPLIERGAYPFALGRIPEDHREDIRAIPGVRWYRGTAMATYDAAKIAAEILGRTLKARDREEWRERRASDYPGGEAFKRIYRSGERKLRPYQVSGVGWLAARNAAIDADPMRSGKSPTLLATCTLRGARRVLIICTAGGRLGWAEEIRTWRPDAKITLLYGRGASVLRAPGERNYTKREQHRERFDATLATADYVIVNYELLIGQIQTGDSGEILGLAAHLPGWAERLQEVEFDAAILDEGSQFLSSDPTRSSGENSIRETVIRVVDSIPIVYEADGTPCRGGRPRTYWGQLDVISGGTWGVDRRGRRMPFSFHARYCDGHHEAIQLGFGGGAAFRQVWKADGTTRENEAELKARLKIWMIQRPRSLILPFMPKKARQTKWIEVDPLPALPPEDAQLKSRVSRCLASTIDTKIAAAMGEIVSELEEGNKVIVFAYRKRSVRRMAAALDKVIKGVRTGAHLRSVNARLWTSIGVGPEEDDHEGGDRGPTTTATQRHTLAKEFREHDGAGVVVATISSLRGVYNMPDETGKHPVTSEHWLEVHPSPDAMLQAEDRPYVPGITRGLAIVYWVVKSTYDEHAVKIMRPQVETLARLQDDEDAAALAGAIERKPPEANWRAAIDSLIADRADRKGIV